MTTFQDYRPLIDSAREYAEWCKTADCIATIQYNGMEPMSLPAHIVDMDSDGKYYVKTHPRSGVFVLSADYIQLLPVAVAIPAEQIVEA